MADEVLTSWGRTGKWLCLEHWGVVPDVVTIGKGFGNVMTYSIGGEWLVSETTPISLSAGYTNVDLPHGAPSLNVFTLGVKFYAGGGAMSLVDRHRNGALGPLTQPILTGLRSVF